jgi:hypothetical protein
MKRNKSRLSTVAFLAIMGLSASSYGADFAVSVASDDGTGDVANTLSWAISQANSTAGDDTITLGTDVTITGVMKRLINSNITLQSDGTPRTISGSDTYRPLFIKSGTVIIQDMTLSNGKAKGGDSCKGGSGAGLGGALFVYGGNVMVDNVTFDSNNAEGGSYDSKMSHGGAGMFGDAGGSGGGGLFASSSSNTGAYGGTNNYNTSATDFGAGGDSNNNGDSGGAGGFGAGGGTGTNTSYDGTGGAGGFGAGSAYGDYGTNGGFGAGGSAGGYRSGYGGYGGGDGGASGGAGAGFGGAIFAMAGELTLNNVTFTSNSVTAGIGKDIKSTTDDGTADAKDLFICTSNLHVTASLCASTVYFSGTTDTTEIVGTPIIILSDTLPTATAVTFSGTLQEEETLTGTYTYADDDSDSESDTSFKWYRSDDINGLNKTEISGETSLTYTLVSADVDKYISFEVTPVNANASGVPTESSINETAVIVANIAPTVDDNVATTTVTPTAVTSTTVTSTATEPEETKESYMIPKEEVISVERPTGNAEQTGTKPQLDNVTRLYIATFGRAPESAGSDYWLYESKLNLEDIARSFFDQEETKGKYPKGFSNYDFIVAIYNNVYGRNPDQAGGDYWLKELDSGRIEKALFILAIINGAIGDDASMLEKQTTVGINFVESGVQDMGTAKKVIDDVK